MNFSDHELTSNSVSRCKDSGDRCLEVVQLGSVPYTDAIDLQENLVMQRKAGLITDRLLLLEHPHVITLGVASRHSRRNILVGSSVLEQSGIEVHETHRGGDVTYHGPGQLIGYVVVNLRQLGWGPVRYVHALEEMLISTLEQVDPSPPHKPHASKSFHIPSFGFPQYPLQSNAPHMSPESAVAIGL